MQIVVINVSRTIAPAPSVLQRTGAFISQGATTLTPGTKQLLQSSGDLTSILAASEAITSLAWSGSVVTATTTSPHGIPTGQIVTVTIAGAVPVGYNGTFQGTSTGASTFTYPLVSNPGSETTPGTYVLGSVAELTAMNTTFWAQGSQTPVYVLELGIDGDVANIGALTTYLTTNPLTIYSMLVPAAWSAQTAMVTLANSYAANSKMTYFFVTMTTGNYANFAGIKSVVGMVSAPGTPTSEFSLASAFWTTLNYRPSPTNKVTPLDYSFVSGVTVWLPGGGNNATLDAILAGDCNYIGNAAAGGLSGAILRDGTTMDGKDFTYWYAIDWAQINVAQAVTAAIINGSNNAQNPLYYNQDGINRLQAVIVNTLAQGVSFGLIFGSPLTLELEPSDFITNEDNGVYAGQSPVNAQSFATYSAANPNDFAAGLYTGFQFAVTPNRGFKNIVIAMNVTDFVTAG